MLCTCKDRVCSTIETKCYFNNYYLFEIKKKYKKALALLTTASAVVAAATAATTTATPTTTPTTTTLSEKTETDNIKSCNLYF